MEDIHLREIYENDSEVKPRPSPPPKSSVHFGYYVFFILCVLVIYNTFDFLSWQSNMSQVMKFRPPRKFEENQDEIRKNYLIKKLDTMPLRLFYSWYKRSNPKWATYYYNNTENELTRCNKTSSLPQMMHIPIRNTYWQYFLHTYLTTPFWFYSAHLDKRPLSQSPYVVRIYFIHRGPVANSSRRGFPPSFYCYAWYQGKSGNKLIVVRKNSVAYLLPFVGLYKDVMPAYLKCHLPMIEGSKPVAVSLAETPCNGGRLTNAFTLADRYKGKDGMIALCLKQVYTVSVDKSMGLLEWIEIQRAIGIDKILIYILALHPAMWKVLNYYQKMEYMEVINVTIPGHQQTHSWWMERHLRSDIKMRRALENVLQNECYYRLHEHFRYVAICDSDEVFLPRNESNLAKFILEEERKNPNKTYSSFQFISAFYPTMKDKYAYVSNLTYNGKTVPPHLLNIMKSVYRTVDKLPTRSKNIHRTEFVIHTTTHWSKGSLKKGVKTKKLQFESGVIAHFKSAENWWRTPFSSKLSKKYHDPQQLIRDPIIWRYKDQVLDGIFKALEELQIFNDTEEFQDNRIEEDFFVDQGIRD